MITSDEDWMVLYDLFSSLKPMASYLKDDKRFTHYLERIFYAANKSRGQTECTLNLIDLLEEIFPNVSITSKKKPKILLRF